MRAGFEGFRGSFEAQTRNSSGEEWRAERRDFSMIAEKGRGFVVSLFLRFEEREREDERGGKREGRRRYRHF